MQVRKLNLKRRPACSRLESQRRHGAVRWRSLRHEYTCSERRGRLTCLDYKNNQTLKVTCHRRQRLQQHGVITQSHDLL